MFKLTSLGSLALALACADAGAASREENWRAQIASALHLPAQLPRLEVQTHGRFTPEPGLVAERVSYSTLHDLRVPAIVYRPEKASGRLPAIVVVNGHGGDKYSWYAYYCGMLYARAGAVVLTFDQIGEGERHSERKSGTRAHDKLEKIPAAGPHLAGQMITDARQAVRVLAQRSDVDPHRIAALGHSMGSFVVSVMGAVDTQVRACVMVGGGNLDGPGGYWDGSKPLCQGWPYQALRPLGDRAAVIYALHAARGPTYVFNGDEDEVMAIPRLGPAFFPELRQRTIALRGSAENVFEFGFERGASHRPFFLTRPVALWLERTLDFPNWTARDIERMPHTHIGTWANERGADMDRSYFTEHRAAGTRALGENIPVLTRTQLSVFSDDEFTKNQSRLTLEHWERRVHALIGKK